MQASQGWWSCIAFTRGSLFIGPTYHAYPDSGARWGPLLSRSSPPPAPGRWRRILGDRSSDSSLHLLWHRPYSSPCSYPNWSLPTYCKRGFRCCRLPTPQIHRRKSAGSRSEIALPRGATVPSFQTPPSFLSPDVELLHPARFRMQMTSLKSVESGVQSAPPSPSASRSSAWDAAGVCLRSGLETKLNAAGAVRPF